MSTPTLELPLQPPTNVVAGDLPIITEPLEGMPVDADYATFTWTTVIGAEGYTLQVARDRDFTDLVVDVSVGDATMLTLFEAFRPDGQPRYGRVSAIINGASQHYSSVVSFRPLADDEFDAQTTRRKRRERPVRTESAVSAPMATSQSGTDIMIPYRMAQSSDAMAAAVLAVGLGAFVLLIMIALLA